MNKSYAKFFVVCILISSLSILFIGNTVSAQPEVELVTDPAPDTGTIHIGTEVKEIWIEARLREKGAKLTWNVDGPGEFNTLEGGIGGIYRVPDHIDDMSAKVSITLTITDDKGGTARNNVTFELIAPTPTPTPPPTPTPVPTPTPAPVNIRQALLRHERFYLSPGETVVIVVDITNPSNRDVKVECEAIKGKAECAAVEKESGATQREIRYTAPDKPGKDMLEIRVVDSTREETDHVLIKLEILDI